MIIKTFKILGILISLYCFNEIDSFQQPFWLLPVLYTFYLFVFRNNEKSIKGSPGLIALNITMFCRYAIVPLVYYGTGITATCAHDFDYINESIWLMLYEQLCVFIAIEVTGKSNRHQYGGVVKVNSYGMGNKMGKEKVFFIISLILFLLLTAFFKDLASGFRVFTSGNFEGFFELEGLAPSSFIDNLIAIVWQMLSIWIYIYAVNTESRSYALDKNKKHIFRSILYSFILILLAFIDQTGLSRWFTIMNASTAIACLCKYYPMQKKTVLAIMGSPMVLLIAYATLIKNGGFELGSSDVNESLANVFITDAFDSYFCGPVNVDNALSAAHKYHTGVNNIASDVLYTIPIINHWIPRESVTLYINNLHAGRITAYSNGDQILPMIGEAYMYFGFILAPFFSVLSVFCIRWFDRRYKEDKSFLTFYYAFSGIWIGCMAMMLNLIICLAWFPVRIIPDYLILRYANKLRKNDK